MWEPQSGDWTLNNELIRKLAPSAKRLRALLDAAQAANWVCPIPNPFAGEKSNSKQRVRYLSRELNILNQDQQKPRVHLSSCDKGRAFEWKIVV